MKNNTVDTTNIKRGKDLRISSALQKSKVRILSTYRESILMNSFSFNFGEKPANCSFICCSQLFSGADIDTVNCMFFGSIMVS